MATVVYGDFEWDDAKAEANMRKHDVSFDEAATAFEDPNHLIVDDGSGDGEKRTGSSASRSPGGS
jgi:uncharacterized DUF497 family protein